MPGVFRFKVTFEDYDDVHREIEIKATQTFFDLHNAIQVAIQFDNTKEASFFISDDNWRKGEEITLNKQPNNPNIKTMDRAKIAAFIDDPHQKIIYLFDPEAHWSFCIELVKILDINPKIDYPKCVRSVGTAPKQYKAVNLPPPDEDLEDDLLPIEKKEKIFTSEEGYDEDEKDEDLMEDGEEEKTDEDDEILSDEEAIEPGDDTEDF